MTAREPWCDALERMADGRLGAAAGRPLLYGLTMPNRTAQLIKEGRWASEGGYPTGDAGLQQAAADALREYASSQESPSVTGPWFAARDDVELIVGDARRVLPTLPPASVDCVVTDPPYGQTSLSWDVRPTDWLELVAPLLRPGGSVWIFGTLRSLVHIVADAERGLIPWRFAQDIVWEKHNGSSFHADRFKRVHEQAVQLYQGRWDAVWKSPVTVNEATARTLRRKRRPPHTGHIEASSYASHDGGPKLMRSVMYVRSCHGRAVHETQKPEGILRPLIEYSCPPGGIVLDPFAGSGSTGIAAREVGRRAVLIEVDVDYAAAAEARFGQGDLLAAGAANSQSVPRP